MQIFFSEKCLEYGNGHVENKERIRKAKEILNCFGYNFLKPKPVSEKSILKVHDSKYLNSLKKEKAEDIDTPMYENIYEYAKLSAGGAVLAAEKEGFSLMRPPGHHAGKNGIALGASSKGFCYLNNIAIAVKHLNQKTLILDIDGHHGNGTQEIFIGNEDVKFISLHGNFYPETGKKSVQNCINITLPPDCGEEIYLKSLNQALGKIDFEEVEVIAVSAGFDSHSNDLASLGLANESFKKIGKIIKKLNKYTFFVLEGGYVGDNLGNDINSLLEGFLN